MTGIIKVQSNEVGIALKAAREIIPDAYTVGSPFGDGVVICASSRYAGQHPTGRGTLSLIDDVRIAIEDAIA